MRLFMTYLINTTGPLYISGFIRNSLISSSKIDNLKLRLRWIKQRESWPDVTKWRWNATCAPRCGASSIRLPRVASYSFYKSPLKPSNPSHQLVLSLRLSCSQSPSAGQTESMQCFINLVMEETAKESKREHIGSCSMVMISFRLQSLTKKW